MTFKHTKFEDSTTMRSLAKVAQEKGWIKEEPLQKTASAPKLDLIPTQNLTENLLKLCAGLRASGFEKQAEELESKFVQYKQANALYDVTKEKGEDLVGAAHPKGSHKLEGVEGKEATFEDILDKHVKMMQVVDKKPTGKLSDANAILSAVKTVLGQANLSNEDLRGTVSSSIGKVLSIVNQIGGLVKNEMTVYSDFEMIKGRLVKASENPDVNGIEEMLSQLDAMETRLSPSSWMHYVSFGVSGISDSTWTTVSALITRAKQHCHAAMDARKALDQRAAAGAVQSAEQPDAGEESKPFKVPEVTVSADPIVGRLTALTNKLKAYRTVPSISRNRQAAGWIDSEIKEIAGVMQGFTNIPEGQEDLVKSQYEKEVARLEGEVSQFASAWLAA